jgi:hypothetical protein
MDEAGRLGAALQHIAASGDLHGLAGDRSEKIALIRFAEMQHLAVWSRWRGRYRLTAEGRRRAAALARRNGPARRRSGQWALAAAGVGAMVAGFIAVGSAHVVPDRAVRTATVAPRQTLAPEFAARNEARAMVFEPEVLPPDPPLPTAAGGARRKVDQTETRPAAGAAPQVNKPRKVARAPARERRPASRPPSYDMGQALAFSGAPPAHRSYPPFPSTSGYGFGAARPNNRWGW